MIGSFAASVLGIASHPAANDASAAGNLAAGIIRPERRLKLVVEPLAPAFNRLRQWVAVILRLIGKHLRVNMVCEKKRFGQAGHDGIQYILIVRGRREQNVGDDEGVLAIITVCRKLIDHFAERLIQIQAVVNQRIGIFVCLRQKQAARKQTQRHHFGDCAEIVPCAAGGGIPLIAGIQAQGDGNNAGFNRRGRAIGFIQRKGVCAELGFGFDDDKIEMVSMINPPFLYVVKEKRV